eukprot:TRINITY_DN4720_c0_g1_i2.p4 TRINITY_DN4720_c0_g1~~TRINITY_DN4720_c0_g1_i2.p4  ORF type:complete len:129 (+),score=20.51 TRINITY_DN4720_c0_g1_i2:1510-1896(+)
MRSFVVLSFIIFIATSMACDFTASITTATATASCAASMANADMARAATAGAAVVPAGVAVVTFECATIMVSNTPLPLPSTCRACTCRPPRQRCCSRRPFDERADDGLQNAATAAVTVVQTIPTDAKPS